MVVLGYICNETDDFTPRCQIRCKLYERSLPPKNGDTLKVLTILLTLSTPEGACRVNLAEQSRVPAQCLTSHLTQSGTSDPKCRRPQGEKGVEASYNRCHVSKVLHPRDGEICEILILVLPEAHHCHPDSQGKIAERKKPR